ncbi:carbohydrate kinase family protein, partial [bacterium]
MTLQSEVPKSVVVFGTVCLDRVRRLPNLPAPGGYVEAVDEEVALGGEAANTAVALAAWGGSPILASNPLGDDADGQDLRERVRARGLDLRELRTHLLTKAPVCDVFVTPDGERTMIGRGFSALDGAIDLSKLPLQSGGLFAAEPNMEEASRAAVRLAAEAGMRTYVMDFIRSDEPLSEGSFWQSSTDWAGRRNNPVTNLRFVDDLVARTGVTAILTDGPNGFVAGAPGQPARFFPPFPTPRTVDATGAGDTFRAGWPGAPATKPLGPSVRI